MNATWPLVVCVIVTRDRPALLRRCIEAVQRQVSAPAQILVLDNASGPETGSVFADYPGVEVVRLNANAGGAAGFAAGIANALLWNPEFIWLMDDDGRAEGVDCLRALLARGIEQRLDIIAPLVLDEDAPERLAFPVRVGGRTHFAAAPIEAMGEVPAFAHLFNGALVRASVFARIGLPDPRYFIRGDEVEFLYRARRAGMRIVLEARARFLHPGSSAEVNPILFGCYYAILPNNPVKRFHMFRNRAYIFSRYGKWGMLAADMVRYGWLFLITRRADVAGFFAWWRATAIGLRGDFTRREFA